jgi:anti-sigma regulatory factor (Ser/Thr protein kinase)
VDEVLVAHGAGQDLRQDAALVVHELVMNSVTHGRPDSDGAIELEWRVVGSQLEVSVLDCGTGGTVAVRHPGAEDPDGRGLAIVAALCTSWWVDHSEGTRVTARLAL